MDASPDTPRNFPDPAEGRRSTLTSIAVNTGLIVVQATVGVLAHSQALVADAVHSLSDVVSDVVVLVAGKHSRKAPDADHQYGHRRFETAASLMLGALLVIVGAAMVWSAFTRLQHPADLHTVGVAALAVALLALCVKELLFRYMLRVARRLRSSLLAANAWHARSDAASSLVVAVGIVANLAGFPLADPLAALIVGIMIARVGAKFFLAAFNDLMDRAVDAQDEARISAHLASTPGVLGVHRLKTRKMGDMIWVEVDLEMDASLTIAEGHAIAEEARKRVMQHEPVLDVMTHFDPVWPRRGPASGPGREDSETARLPQPGRHSD
jgi:cation diffusion facilitator family transporter